MRLPIIFDARMWSGRPRPLTASRKIAQAGNSYCRFIFCAALALSPYATAQRASAPARATAPAHSGHSFSPARNAHPSAFRRSSPLVSPFGSLPFPFFGDSFNPDDIYSTGYPVASQPPPFLMDAVRQMAGSATTSMGQAVSSPNHHQPSSSDPLMIELQNGRYVRVNSTAIDGEALPLNLPSSHDRPNSSQPFAIAAASSSQILPAAVLIFRDGHSEEVRDYTIADGMLYARGDYYTDGYWNKKIDLATLSVAETMQANANRSVRFVLPSSPNEVITRP